jgi:hypothetical protein
MICARRTKQNLRWKMIIALFDMLRATKSSSDLKYSPKNCKELELELDQV